MQSNRALHIKKKSGTKGVGLFYSSLATHSPISTILRHRIVATSSPRMTTQDTSQSKPAPLYRSVLTQSLQGILRAGRRESATRWFQRRNTILIKLHQCNKRENGNAFTYAHKLVPRYVARHFLWFYNLEYPLSNRPTPNRVAYHYPPASHAVAHG